MSRLASFREILRSLKSHRYQLSVALVFILLHTTVGFLLIFFSTRFSRSQVPIFLVSLFSIHHLFSVFDDWMLTGISQHWILNTRIHVMKRFMKSPGPPQAHSHKDWSEIQMEIQWLGDCIFSFMRSTLRKSLQILVFSVALILLSPKLFLVCLALFVCLFLMGTFLGKAINRLQEKVINSSTQCSVFETELARNVFLVRAYKNSNFFSSLHNQFLKESTQDSILLSRLRMLFHPLQILLFLMTLILVYFFGTKLVSSGQLPESSFFAFVAGLSLLHAPLSGLSQDISIFFSFRNMNHLDEILHFDNDSTQLTQFVHPKKTIEVSNLSFQYHQDALSLFDSLNFSISAGEILAISGPNGSGKTTLGCLLAGIYEPSFGKISIDGETGSLPFCSFVDQHGSVFHLSLRENLFLSDSKVQTFFSPILESIQNQEISPEALSAGQKKIISIQRALSQNFSFFVIDEPENALDSHHLDLLRKIILDLKEKKAFICIISHSQEFLSLADRTIDLSKQKNYV